MLTKTMENEPCLKNDTKDIKETVTPQKFTLALVLLLGSQTLIELAGVSAQILHGAVPNLELNLLRYGLLLLLVVIPIILKQRIDVRLPRKKVPFMFFGALAATALNISYFAAAKDVALGTLSAMVAGIAIALNTLTSICIKAERSAYLYGGAVIAFIGLILMAQPDFLFHHTATNEVHLSWTPPCVQMIYYNISNISTKPEAYGNITAIQPEAIWHIDAIQPEAIGNIATIQPEAIGNVTAIQPEAIGSITAIQPKVIGNIAAIKPEAIGNIITAKPGVVFGDIRAEETGVISDITPQNTRITGEIPPKDVILIVLASLFIMIQVSCNKRIVCDGVNPIVVTLWMSVTGTVLSIIVMPIVEQPVLLTSPYCIMLLLLHCVCVEQSMIIIPWAAPYLVPPIITMSYVMPIIVQLICQYTFLKNIQPGFGNWEEIFGGVLCSLGIVWGPLFSMLCHRNK